MKKSSKTILISLIGFFGGSYMVAGIMFQRIVFEQTYPRYILLATSAILMGVSFSNFLRGLQEKVDGD